MSLRKNMISNLLLTSSSVLFPLITFPYITRTLSNTSIGKYFFVDAFAQYFIIFSAVGIPFYGIREIAKIKNDLPARSKLVAELLLIQVTLAIIFSIIFIVAHYYISDLKNEFNLVKVACFGIISTSFLMEWFYQGIANYTYITSRSLILKTISVVSILLLVKKFDDYLIYYLLGVILTFSNAILNFANYLKNYHTVFTNKLDIRPHIKPLLVLFSINVSISVYAVLDTIILGLLTNPTNVSYYNIPLKLVKIFWTVTSGAGMVLIPQIASYFADKNTDGISVVMQKSLNIVFLLTIPFCFFCLMFPNEILVAISGQKYLHAINALRILSVVPFIIAACNVFGTQFLMPIGEEKSILYATIIGLLISLSLNFLLVPYLKFLGAAITCVVAEGAVCLYIFISARKRIRVKVDLSLIIQICVCLIFTLLARFFLLNYLNGLLLVISSLIAYILSLVILQYLYFKNEFIFSLIKFGRAKQ